ncbi:MAG: POTRA domain-containing protein [Candidatus Aminicenantaceae bacterium]
MISIKKGEEFSFKKISESIKHIFKTGLFSDIQVLKSGEQDVHLTFLLSRRLFTRGITFLGEHGISEKKLRESLYALRENSPFSKERLNRAIEELKEVLEKEGYFHPEIRATSKDDFQSSSVDVYFEISPGKRYLIKKIYFSGEVLLSEDRLKKKMKSQEGQVYIPSVVEEDIRQLEKMYHLMEYQRALIEVDKPRFDDGEGSVNLTFNINPHEKINIIVRGATVPIMLLRPIWEERIFEEWGLAEGEAKILSFLRKDGYIFATVKSSIKRTDNEIEIIYGVSPGDKVKIEDVAFEGIKYFTPDRLKKELEINKKIPLLSWIDGERLFELPKEIEMVYRIHGFPQTRVDLNFIRQEKKVRAVYYVEEGIQEKIESIHVEGASLFSRKKILEQISSVEGGPFFRPHVQRDIEKLENFYLNKGVRGTEIAVNVEKKSDNIASLRFNIREGKRVKIEIIVVTGNLITKRSTIFRELRIKEGDYAYYDAIVESKRRLERLGIFSEIRIEEVPLSPSSENLIIRLREGKRNYLGIGIGLETKREPYTFRIWDSVIRPRGTAEFIRGNILGIASQLSLVAQISLKEKRGVISWEQPYIFGLPWRSSLNAWMEREQRKSFGYNRRGISLTAIKSPLEDIILLATLRWVRTNLFNLEIAESEVDRQHHPFSTSSISGSFIWDRRDDPFNPERGSFLSFVAEWAYPIFNAESDYLKNFVKYQQFLPILSSFAFSTTARFGIGTGRVPIHERFFGGGSNSFRGESFDELGPADPTSQKPVGGKALLLLNFEFRFPFFGASRNLYGAVFYDKGNIFPEMKNIAFKSLQDALGFGIRYRTPLGPVRFDLGWNLDAPEGERKVLAFITIGNVF